MWFHWGSQWFLLFLPKKNTNFPSGGRGGTRHKDLPRLNLFCGLVRHANFACLALGGSLYKTGYSAHKRKEAFWLGTCGRDLLVWDRQFFLNVGLLAVEFPYHCSLTSFMYLNRKRESLAHRHCHFFVAGTLLMVPLAHPLQSLALRDVLGWR